MLRAAIQAEHRARHELDTLQAQPLPEQNSVHIVRDLHPEKHAARLLRIRQGQMPCVHDRLRHAEALARILRDQPLQMRCIQPTLKIQRQHFLLERRACDICIEFCKDQPLFKPAGNEQITEAQARHERLGKRIQVQHGIAVVQTAECLARATVKCQIPKTVVLNDRKAVFLRQRQQLPTFALAPADIRRALEIRHRVVKIKGRLIEHGAHSVHIWPIRQQRDGHYPRTGALEAMQRDRIAGVLGEHDRILADKRLADEVDALLAAVDDKNILIRGRDAARGQMLPQRLRVGG